MAWDAMQRSEGSLHILGFVAQFAIAQARDELRQGVVMGRVARQVEVASRLGGQTITDLLSIAGSTLRACSERALHRIPLAGLAVLAGVFLLIACSGPSAAPDIEPLSRLCPQFERLGNAGSTYELPQPEHIEINQAQICDRIVRVVYPERNLSVRLKKIDVDQQRSLLACISPPFRGNAYTALDVVARANVLLNSAADDDKCFELLIRKTSGKAAPAEVRRTLKIDWSAASPGDSTAKEYGPDPTRPYVVPFRLNWTSSGVDLECLVFSGAISARLNEHISVFDCIDATFGGT